MTQPHPTHASLDDWIARAAVSFDMDSPGSLNTAVDGMIAAMGDAVELLGFGEALHGGEEILILRNRMFQRLVEAHHFSAIAVESSFRAHILNDFVAGIGDATYESLCDQGFSHGFGGLAANRELLEWMRQYNPDPSHTVKIRFYGFDSPTEMMYSDSPRQLLKAALDHLDLLGGAADRRQRINALIGDDAEWETPAAAFDPSKSIGLSPAANALRLETENLITELQLRRPDSVATGGADDYSQALHHAILARQLLTYHAAVALPSPNGVADLLGQRDLMMACNLAHLVERERGRGKVLAFAHNSHLKRGKARWQLGPTALAWWPAGAHLHHMLGNRYAIIGTGVGVSDANGIGQPEAGALEHLLAATPGPNRLIPTHLGRSLPAAKTAALVERTASKINGSYFPLNANSLTDFDWLAVLDSTTYSRGGPALAR